MILKADELKIYVYSSELVRAYLYLFGGTGL
jgi:hypothetical protein